MKEAMFYEKRGKNVQCLLCQHKCTISEGKRGICGVRKNVNGRLISLVYGKPCSVAMDPIEKKPLFHFAPGSQCLSIATVGCNFRCLHCQNWEISQVKDIEGEDMSPEMVVAAAKANHASGIAYTYTEPTIFYEYALDTMKLAKKAGLYNVWVSNGYTSPDAIKIASKYLDAVNVDVKGNDEFYRKVCKAAGIAPVYEALLAYKKHGVFLEITTLVIPGYNDKSKDIKGIVGWVKSNLGPDLPLHFSAFYPQNKMTDVPPTSLKTLEMCYDIAKKEGMKWVYLGNVRSERESTFCSRCGQIAIERSGYNTIYYGEKCRKCGAKIPIAGAKWAGRQDI